MNTQNPKLIWIAIIMAVAPTISSVASLIVALRASDKVEAVAVQVEEVRHATNSMKDALVAGASREGVTKGIKQERNRQSQLPLLKRGQ